MCLLGLVAFCIDPFSHIHLKKVVELGSKIPKWYGICEWDTIWMNVKWMKFLYFEFKI